MPGKTGFSRSHKVVLSVALIALAASLVGLGAYATWNDSVTSGAQTVNSGTLDVELAADGTGNRISVVANNVAPGDTVQRAVNLTNDGSVDFGSVKLTTAATVSSVLDNDPDVGNNDIKMKIERCSVAWTESGAGTDSDPYTYTCSGTTSTVLARGEWIVSNSALSNLDVAAGATNHLAITLDLPTGAGNGFQGKQSKVTYTFAADQSSTSSSH